jgi:hypothetical protein
MRMAAIAAVVGLSLASAAIAGNAPPEVQAALNELHGQVKYTKVDLIRLQHVVGGADATHIYADGHVVYKIKTGFRHTENTSPEEFTKDVQRWLQQNESTSNIRMVGKGSKVTITKTQAEGQEVELELRDSQNSKHKLRLNFRTPDNKKDFEYTAADIQRLVAAALADSEDQAKGTATTELSLGMTIDEVVEAKGAPKTRANLGAKTILSYDDMKLVFEDGKLTDVQ